MHNVQYSSLGAPIVLCGVVALCYDVLITKWENSLHGGGGIFKLGVAKWEIA